MPITSIKTVFWNQAEPNKAYRHLKNEVYTHPKMTLGLHI